LKTGPTGPRSTVLSAVAESATLAARHSRILGVFLKDGNGKRDGGLMAGTVHLVRMVDLFLASDRLAMTA
jgi:hypothetical protein